MRRFQMKKYFPLVTFGIVFLFLIVRVNKLQTWRPHMIFGQNSQEIRFLKRETFSYNDSKEIVCVNFKGRLGNLMIEYVFLYIIAKIKRLYPIVPENSELFEIFNIQRTTLSAIKKPKNACSKLPLQKERWGLSYDENLLSVPPSKGVRFDGYYQSWKYWIKYEEEIRDIFTFKESIRKKAYTQMRDILNQMKFIANKDNVVVSVHIRRGDYATKGHYKYGKLTPNETYYANAMDYFKNRYRKVLFIVGSNDLEWSKKALANETNVYYSTGNSAAEDIALLSLANHTIMSVGTFGWWIGWMARGTSIYYKNIFRPGSDFAKEFRNNSVDDFIYPGWIPME
ncbi:galactoside alpha-(1,2)-fucosyltransferase 2-like [Saccostrea echinata]|uniref:galactoside alpha-(1,2)-fucosyltransferase 2-like n=1 Tax=Saccostrea echinata TaxID=191078 RepID=UPI002A7EF82C|nr:galactoside alpha-(1,2)-fucosyltransferase 2-like [Saccostrea echinata]XP_061181962.1 galactoside alpha-(1,2)-fucosyltransferase 2-like [Saccostrea echinata]